MRFIDYHSRDPSPPYAGGQIFSVPLFRARKAQYLRAPAFFLVDAAGHISPIFDLRVRISLFFLCCLVDVSISRSQYSSGFLRLGWTLPVARHRGVKPGECRPQAGSRHQPAALARQQSARSRHSFCYLYSIEPKSGEWRIKSARLATGPLNEVSERCTR